MLLSLGSKKERDRALEEDKETGAGFGAEAALLEREPSISNLFISNPMCSARNTSLAAYVFCADDNGHAPQSLRCNSLFLVHDSRPRKSRTSSCVPVCLLGYRNWEYATAWRLTACLTSMPAAS